jgi:uncharacterized iron-regulated membrane protein
MDAAVIWLIGLAVWTVGLVALAWWMRRREAEVERPPSTMTDQERAQAQLAIAMGGSNTFGSR